jgi:hypothetical protein
MESSFGGAIKWCYSLHVSNLGWGVKVNAEHVLIIIIIKAY